MAKKKSTPRPTREELVEFVQTYPDQGAVRHVARAFHLKGEDRAWLKAELKELAKGGFIAKKGKRLSAPDVLPPVGVLLIHEENADGDLMAVYRDMPDASDLIFVKAGKFAPKVGDRILGRLDKVDEKTYTAKIIKMLERPVASIILGIYREGRVVPTDGKIKREFLVDPDEREGLGEGDLLRVKRKESKQQDRFGLSSVDVLENLGSSETVAGACAIALQSHEIPQIFPDEAIAEADAAKAPTIKGREDLRAIPLVTIDGITARDFDDAVYAEPLIDPESGKCTGWRLLVAIADVASYVLPGSALDKEARKRGNSVYLPDRVVPMLPENLSNKWCSLVPDEDRACLAVWMTISDKGQLKKSRFVRGLMRSHARLTYEQVQAHRDKAEDADKLAIADEVIDNLYGAFECLAQAREKRGTLELDIPDYEIELDETRQQVKNVAARARLDAHKLIEEFMILANVAAAKSLEMKNQALLFRVHEAPAMAKLEALNIILKALDLPLLKTGAQPSDFARVLQAADQKGVLGLLSPIMLRSQSQAVYQEENFGHFGLALASYAHFTSPIRRYADLIVHRALIKAMKLSTDKAAEDALPDVQAAELGAIGEHISTTERKAALAERDSKDRLLSFFMAESVGAELEVDVVSVTKFGMFVQVPQNGAQGLLPFSGLPEDRYHFDEEASQLIGMHRGEVFSLGDKLLAELVEADGDSGRMSFSMLERKSEAMPAVRKLRGSSRGSGRGSGRKSGGGFRKGGPSKGGRSRSAVSKAGYSNPKGGKPGRAP